MNRKYFVVSDIHSYYTILKQSLDSAGYDQTNPRHYLIICGDLFDRGSEANALLNFLLAIPEHRLILIRGNHEDLFDALLEEITSKSPISFHHLQNGTLSTLSQLVSIPEVELMHHMYDTNQIKARLKDYNKLISTAVNYYELGTYIFVHGWIPVMNTAKGEVFHDNWREASDSAWAAARWFNGIEYAHKGFTVWGSTVVCGHWHTSFGHYNYKSIGDSEFSDNACFDIYKEHGINAIDSCVARTSKINVLVLDESAIFDNYKTIMKNKALVTVYPFLLPRNRFTGEVPEDYDFTYTELDNFPTGWRKAFGLKFCKDIKKLFGAYSEHYRLLDIKEKWGKLCIYDSGYPKCFEKEYWEIINKYEKLSEHTCIECGAKATYLSTGRISPYCDKCLKELAIPHYKQIT